MSKHIVVSLHRDSYRHPVLTIRVEKRCDTAAGAQKFITSEIMKSYEKRNGKHYGRRASMFVFNYRVVDELGLKRLFAAAKASKTLRRKRAAKKAAVTRAKNRAARMPRPVTVTIECMSQMN